MESGKLLNDLKVVEIKAELEKRGLEKSGVKAVLLERLKEALLMEDIDTETYTFNGDHEFLNETGDESYINEDDEKCEDLASEDNTESDPTTPFAAPMGADVNIIPPPAGVMLTMDDILKMKEKRKAESGMEGNASMIVNFGEDQDLDSIASEMKKYNSEILDGGGAPTACESSTLETTSEDLCASSKASELPSDVNARKSEAMEAPVQEATKPVNVWVSNITDEVKAANLKELFNQHGKVISARIVVNKKVETPLFYGFLQVATDEDADVCVENLNDTEFMECQLCVTKNVPPKPPTSDVSAPSADIIGEKKDKKLEEKEVEPKPDSKKPNLNKEKEEGELDGSFKRREGLQGRNYRGREDEEGAPTLHSRYGPRPGYGGDGYRRPYGRGFGDNRPGFVGRYKIDRRFNDESFRREPEERNYPGRDNRDYPAVYRGRSYYGDREDWGQRSRYVQEEKFSDVDSWRDRKRESELRESKRTLEEIRIEKERLKEERSRLEMTRRRIEEESSARRHEPAPYKRPAEEDFSAGSNKFPRRSWEGYEDRRPFRKEYDERPYEKFEPRREFATAETYKRDGYQRRNEYEQEGRSYRESFNREERPFIKPVSRYADKGASSFGTAAAPRRDDTWRSPPVAQPRTTEPRFDAYSLHTSRY